MSSITFLGGFPQVAIALTGAFGCALGIAFLILRAILGFMNYSADSVSR